MAAEAQNASDEQHGDRMDDSRNRIIDALARINARTDSRIIDAIGTNVAGECTESQVTD